MFKSHAGLALSGLRERMYIFRFQFFVIQMIDSKTNIEMNQNCAHFCTSLNPICMDRFRDRSECAQKCSPLRSPSAPLRGPWGDLAQWYRFSPNTPAPETRLKDKAPWALCKSYPSVVQYSSPPSRRAPCQTATIIVLNPNKHADSGDGCAAVGGVTIFLSFT